MNTERSVSNLLDDLVDVCCKTPNWSNRISDLRNEILSIAQSEADERECDEYLIERLSGLLAKIALAVNGPFPGMGVWSYHDLPEKVEALKKQADRIERALAVQGEVERDAERLDFLESLMKRKRKFGWQDKEWPLDTDLHISAMGAALYARSGIGSDCDFSARGKTVRETIDAARTQEKSK